MAIALSHLFTQIVGSVNGITYFHNRYASICARARVVPVDPRTFPQQTVRARMSAAVSRWQALAADQRLSWETYAAGTPWLNSLGQDTRLTGFNMYIAVCLAVLRINPTADMDLLKTAYCLPGMFILPDFYFTFPAAPNTGFILNFSNPHATDSMRIGVHMSTAQNTSVNFWKGPYHAPSYKSTAAIAPGFGLAVNYLGLTAGKRYFMRIRAWNSTQKTLISSPTLVSCVALAGT